MAESLYLEMPVRKKSFAARLLRLPIVISAVAGVLIGLCWWWLASGRVDSVWGMLDGMIYAVSPDFSGSLRQCGCGKGIEWRRTAGGAHGRRRLCRPVASKRIQEAVRLRPPDHAGNRGPAQAGSGSGKRHCHTACPGRNEEEAKRIQREDRVTEHVRAQLAVRSLDSQGGERAVGKSRYATARRAEGEARARMQSAKDEFEQVSRMRAALDQELGRVRDEMLRARQLASRNRYAPSAVSRPSSGPCLWRWTTPCMRR